MEVCPRCRELREVRVTRTRTTEPGEDGIVRDVEIVARHCSVCGSFVRREVVPVFAG